MREDGLADPEFGVYEQLLSCKKLFFAWELMCFFYLVAGAFTFW